MFVVLIVLLCPVSMIVRYYNWYLSYSYIIVYSQPFV